MRTLHTATDGYLTAVTALKRSPIPDNPAIEKAVRDIIEQVRNNGDNALLELGRKFDSSILDDLEVTDYEWTDGCAQVDGEMRRVLELAAVNITYFHEKQKRTSWMDAQDGRVLGQTIRPLDRVGVYVPGGRAVYPSSVLMCAIPARVAGVAELVMCTPCGRDGQVNPLILYAARLAGISRIFKIGGAQAVAAMAFGTATVPVVDKVVGPGNVYVNLAKRVLYGVVDIDMLAGPSEVCVVADDGADPAFVAADMLTQAEHDPDCAAYLITDSPALAVQAELELERRLESLPRRNILRTALDLHGAIIVAETIEQALDLANECAPEHLALMVRDPFGALSRIKNAGAILMGDYAPQTLGDYLAGPSHTLPTNGTARFESPLNVDTFLKKTNYIYYTDRALSNVGPNLIRFAEAEGFQAHADAVRARMRDSRSYQ